MNTKKQNHSFDLEERTAKFAENIIDLVKKLKVNSINKRIVEQLVGSGGSIGANYSEATESESKKDFIHKISIAKKEIKETKHWLRLMARSNPETKKEIRNMWLEAQELLLIFSKIIQSCRKPTKS